LIIKGERGGKEREKRRERWGKDWEEKVKLFVVFKVW